MLGNMEGSTLHGTVPKTILHAVVQKIGQPKLLTCVHIATVTILWLVLLQWFLPMLADASIVFSVSLFFFPLQDVCKPPAAQPCSAAFKSLRRLKAPSDGKSYECSGLGLRA